MRHRRENSHRKRNNKHTFADDDRCTYRTFPKYRAATARRTVLYRRAARNRAVLCGMGVRRYGGAASDGSCRTGRHLALFGIAVPFHLDCCGADVYARDSGPLHCHCNTDASNFTISHVFTRILVLPADQFRSPLQAAVKCTALCRLTVICRHHIAFSYHIF